MTTPFRVALLMLLVATGTFAQQQTAPRPGLPVASVEQTAADDDDEGVIRGRVSDATSGRPLAGATVMLYRRTFVPAAPHAAFTDAAGRYSARGLRPGVYQLHAEAEGFVAQTDQTHTGATVWVEVAGGQVVSGVDMELPRAATVGGQIFDISGDGFAGVEVELLAERRGRTRSLKAVKSARSDAFGRFRFDGLPAGPYYVRAHTATPVPGTSSDRPTAYAPTYFPSVTRPEEAFRLFVEPGQQLEGVDYALSVVETATVSGTLSDVTGRSVDDARVTMMRTVGGRGPQAILTSAVSRDGAFSFSGVIPGEYALWAGGRAGLARQHLTVDDDIGDVSLVIQPGVRVTGRIVIDGPNSSPVSADTDLTVVATTRISGGGRAEISIGTGAVGEMAPDGSFTLDGVVSPAVLSVIDLSGRVPSPSIRWVVKAVRLATGTDITDQPTDFTAVLNLPVEIVVTDRTSEVTGHVTDDRGERVETYTVVVFPQDRSRWSRSARIRDTQAHRGGDYRIERLVGGDYLAVAVRSLPRNAWRDPDVRRQLWPQAKVFRLDDGERKTVNLELARTPPGLSP